MSWLSKALKKGAKYTPGEQIRKAAGISKNNTLYQALNPGGAAIANIAAGEPITGRNILDPGHWVSAPDVRPKVQTVNPNNARNLVAAQMGNNSNATQTRGGVPLPMSGPSEPAKNYGDINAIIDYVGQRGVGTGMVNETEGQAMANPKGGSFGDFLVRDPKRMPGRIYR